MPTRFGILAFVTVSLVLVAIVAFMTVPASAASLYTSRPGAEADPTEVRVSISVINVDKVDDVEMASTSAYIRHAGGNTL